MISIVTPCRNAEKTIERTITSVISQNFDNYEYIIIDGLSTDATLEIIKKYAQLDGRIKYISEKDNSMTEALNKGFKMAKGDIVCSINADDFYLPGTLAEVQRLMDENSYDILFGSTFFLKNGRYSFSSFPRYMCNRFMLNILDCTAPECSVFFRKEAIKECGFFSEKYKYTQDYEIYIRMTKNGCKLGYCSSVFSIFYISDEQYSASCYNYMLKEACSYNEHPTLFKFLKISHLNNIIKRAFGWIKK